MKSLEGDMMALANIREAFFDALEGMKQPSDMRKNDSVRYSLNEYTDNQKENWAESKSIVLYEDQAQLEEFIDTAVTDKDYHKKIYFGDDSGKLSRKGKIGNRDGYYRV